MPNNEEWRLEQVDLPGFRGEFAMRGSTLETMEFQGFLATVNMLNDQIGRASCRERV